MFSEKKRNRSSEKLQKFGASVFLISLSAFSLFGLQQQALERLTLDQCISLAIQNNPQILSSLYNVEESEERITEARAGFYPTLTLSASADRLSGSSGQAGAQANSFSSYSTGVSSRYYLFQGWKTVSASSAARSNFEATSYQHESNLQDLILRLKQAYYRLLQAEHLVKVAEQSVERAKYHLEFAQARFEAGLATRSDILKAEVELSNSNLSLIRSRNSRLSLQGSLNVLLGREANSPLSVVDDLGILEQKGKADFDSLLATAHKHRPELQKMNSQLQVQKSNIQLARSNLFPWISADATYNFSGPDLSSLNKGWSAGLSLSFPIFTGFSVSSRVTQERIAYLALEKQRSSLEQQISLDVWNAFLAFKEAEERIDNTQKFLENARENLNIAEEEYREGVGSMIEVIDAQTNLVAAEESHIEALADFKIAQAALDRALGVKTQTEKQGEGR